MKRHCYFEDRSTSPSQFEQRDRLKPLSLGTWKIHYLVNRQ